MQEFPIIILSRAMVCDGLNNWFRLAQSECLMNWFWDAKQAAIQQVKLSDPTCCFFDQNLDKAQLEPSNKRTNVAATLDVLNQITRNKNKQEYILKTMIRITKLRELPLQNLVMKSFQKKKSSLTDVLLRSMIHSFTTDDVRQVAQICASLVVLQTTLSLLCLDENKSLGNVLQVCSLVDSSRLLKRICNNSIR